VASVKSFKIQFLWITKGIHMSLFRQKHFPDFDFNVGTGAEYIVVGGDYLVFSSSGILQRISLVSPEKDGAGSWRIESLVVGDVNLLYQGTFTQVEERFKLIKGRARGRRSSSSSTSFRALLIASLLAAVSVCGLLHVGQRHDPRVQVSSQDQIDFSELVDAMKLSGMDYGQLLPTLTQRAEMTPEALRGVPPTAQQVVPEVKTQVERAPETETAGNGLPKYSPDLYKEPQTLPVAASPSEKTEPTAEPEKIEAEQRPVNDAAQSNVAAELKQELAKLSPDEAAEVLRKVSMLTPGQMTGDALASFPPNLRVLIEQANSGETNEAGILTTDESGVPIKVIMLPGSVIDKFRTHDGISSIPENTSWQARGNPTVHLPLPGGGDIQNVTDLEKFGLKP
jgi:hypothetical protein